MSDVPNAALWHLLDGRRKSLGPVQLSPRHDWVIKPARNPRCLLPGGLTPFSDRHHIGSVYEFDHVSNRSRFKAMYDVWDAGEVVIWAIVHSVR